MTCGQCIHDPVADASPPPTDKAIIASGTGTIGRRQVALGSAGAHNPKDAVQDAPVVNTGMPRGLFGRNDLMATHSKSVSAYRMIRGSRFGRLNHV